MKLIQCPDVLLERDHGNYLPVLFLAGGITSCPFWQDVVIEKLKDMSIVLLNPRRKIFDVNDPTITEAQIRWEYHHINQATEMIFWFPCETLCPITLFELGRALQQETTMHIGCHPDYERKEDVRIQSELMRQRGSPIQYNLNALCNSIRAWHGRGELVE